MNQTDQTNDTHGNVPYEELIAVLTAISVVSKCLAKKLSMRAGRSQSIEGGKLDEQNERTGRRDC